jgi:hypothetical protein
MPRHETKVPKPYPDFPLFAHADGRWKKKIGGLHVTFGPVAWPDPVAYEQSWKAAREAWEKHKDAKRTGDALAADPGALPIGTIVDAYLTRRHTDTEAGELKPRTFAAMRTVLSEYRLALGDTTTLRSLEEDPRPIHAFIATLDVRYGFHAFNRLNRYLRSMWIWGAKPEIGLLERPFKWASLHTKKPIRQFRKQRRLERADGVFKTFEVDEVAALLKFASPFMRGVVSLGYFAGYGNTDISEFPKTVMKVYEKDEAISLHGRSDVIPAGWALLDFPRPKTEIDRAALVPPCVVAAIRAVELLKRPVTKETRSLVFRTEGGKPLVYDVVHRDEDGLIDRTTPTDNLRMSFERLVDRIGKCEVHGWVERKKFVRGKARSSAAAVDRIRQDQCPTCEAALKMMKPRGFYCLRHTATTFAAGSGASSDTRNLFEGHGSGGVRQAFYLDPTKLHDLLLIGRDLLRRVESVTAVGSASTRSSSPASVSAPAAA